MQALGMAYSPDLSRLNARVQARLKGKRPSYTVLQLKP